eukprot:TRINITY_DN4052_c0_g1_i1.p1 TRINITY_DN4052_c0_g1~~TRINITY_DN4052_c0_g1_i1.p1  ORF type:complete len:538 (-),score=127.80 TRINITY_DN4052_c0_g1_i1:506-2119(-)
MGSEYLIEIQVLSGHHVCYHHYKKEKASELFFPFFEVRLQQAGKMQKKTRGVEKGSLQHPVQSLETVEWNGFHSFSFQNVKDMKVSLNFKYRVSKEAAAKSQKEVFTLGKTSFKLEDFKIDRQETKLFTLHEKKGFSKESRGEIQLKINLTVKEKARDKLKLFVTTWNVGNAPPQEDLSVWLPKKGDHVDLVVVGVQECNYEATKGTRPASMNGVTCEKDFLYCLEKQLTEFDCLGYTSLWQIRIYAFAHKSVRKYVSQVKKSAEATGAFKVAPNKGGVAISFHFHQSSFCFVSAHFAAHQDKTNLRNENFREIISGISFPGVKGEITAAHHYLIWMGDLNYRITYGDQGDSQSPSAEQFNEMVSIIQKGEYGKFLQFDQLKTEMKNNRVFCGFQEGPLNFPPTFKVLRVPELQYLNQRSPAWCDRVLWKVANGYLIKQLSLTAATQVSTSDHKPVCSLFEVESRYIPKLADGGECQIILKNLKGRNLRASDVNDSSDPYVKFLAPFFNESYKTSTLKVVSELDDNGIPICSRPYRI